MLYTMEYLEKVLTRRNKGVITSEEAAERALQINTLITISSLKHKVFFFSDDHCFGYNLLPKDFVPCTSSLPQFVVPRDRLPSGAIRSTEDYIKIFHDGEHQITSLKELSDFLNGTLK